MVLQKFRVKFPLLAASGLLTGLCFAWYRAGFLALFTMIPMMLVLLFSSEQDKRPFRFYGYGYIWGVFFYAAVFYWFKYQYPLEYLGFSKAEAIGYVALTWFGIGFILSLLHAVWHFLTGIFMRSRLCRAHRWTFIPFCACLYVLVEYLFTLGELATPWARLALTQQSNILGIQTASLFGSYFISFIVVLVNAILSYGIYFLIKNKDKRKTILSLAVSCAVFFGNMAVGVALYGIDLYKTDGMEKYPATALQGNIVSGRTKTGGFPDVFERFTAMSEDEINGTGTKLIVMPEGCFSIDLKNYPAVREQLVDLAAEHDTVLIIGCYEYADNGNFYNVTWCISPDGTVSGPYRKQHPVPFGEFTPAKNVILKLFPFLEDVTSIGDELSPGEQSVVFDSTLGRIGMFICYDSSFENIGCEAVNGGAVILTESTNDSWYMDSRQLYEHNGHAILRAVESRRYMVRSAAAGYSTVIDSRGKVIASVDALTAGCATAYIAPRTDISFYDTAPMLFPAICLGAVILCFVGSILFKKAQKQ